MQYRSCRGQVDAGGVRPLPRVKKGGDRHFWARRRYVDTVGRNEEMMRGYIKKQEEVSRKEDSVFQPF
ncbi:MAG: transposase [Eubacteriaceae bacterium]|nr:transposase [Eubacteriaceae bacterium]